ncbi:MAG: hypothetical protein QME54_01725 [Actinomycetota bacterium]|nr:hypothetical protein [Actinomycetota bacterium]
MQIRRWQRGLLLLYSLSEKQIKHIKNIQKDEKLKLWINHFDFEFLDSSTRRFDLVLQENKRREHPIMGKFGPRPYLLEDLERMRELWEDINGKLTASQINKLKFLCAGKLEEWGLRDKNPSEDKGYEEFIMSSVENICDEVDVKTRERLTKAILSGMFFDVIELFMTLKSK